MAASMEEITTKTSRISLKRIDVRIDLKYQMSPILSTYYLRQKNGGSSHSSNTQVRKHLRRLGYLLLKYSIITT